MNNLPTQEYVSACLDYNPETGVLTWKKRPVEHFASEAYARRWWTRNAGKEAGSVCPRGRTEYRRIGLDDRIYKAHRLAWLLAKGKWPTDQIDHINGDGLDNRLVNLQEADDLKNKRNRNMQLNNSSGVTGVYWHKGNRKWHAQIMVDGKNIHLGDFDIKEEAIAARLAAEREYGFTERHGKPEPSELVARLYLEEAA